MAIELAALTVLAEFGTFEVSVSRYDSANPIVSVTYIQDTKLTTATYNSRIYLLQTLKIWYILGLPNGGVGVGPTTDRVAFSVF